MIVLGCLLSGCSNIGGEMPEKPVKESPETNDSRIYFYEGKVSLYDEDGKEVYYINRPMMTPCLYGYTIPIPLLEYEKLSRVKINLGEGKFIDDNALTVSVEDRKFTASLPKEGTVNYSDSLKSWEYLSIERISENVIEVSVKDIHIVRILTQPIPAYAADHSTGRFLEFENSKDYSLPDTIGIELLGAHFLDNYRPIRQYNMVVL